MITPHGAVTQNWMRLAETLLVGLLAPLLMALAFTLPLCVLALALWRAKKAHRAVASEPFTQLPLRPPGESLRLEIEKLSEAFDEQLLMAGGAGFVAVTGTIVAPPALRVFTGCVLFVISAGVTFYVWRKIRKLAGRLWDYRLGFMGERVVGEELNQLLASGFRVFHDVPFGGFNIDDVLVGEPGVYAVETKTRRKPADLKGTEKATVTFDGEQPLFPKGRWNKEWLEQARRNARTLSEWLSSATGERVAVNAILTLPGWRWGRG